MSLTLSIFASSIAHVIVSLSPQVTSEDSFTCETTVFQLCEFYSTLLCGIQRAPLRVNVEHAGQVTADSLGYGTCVKQYSSNRLISSRDVSSSSP